MTSYLLAGPAAEPLTLAEAKTYCRVDGDTEDGLLTTLIAAARLHVEGVTGRALLTQTWRLVCDDWPVNGIIELPVGPLQSLTAVTAYDADGEPVDIDPAQLQAEAGAAPAKLFLPATVAGAPVLRAHLGLEFDYVAGYGDDAADVPAPLRQALLVLVAYWYENRDAVIAAGSGGVIPGGFEALVAPHRLVRL